MRLVIPYLYSIALSLNNVVSRNFFERTLAVALSRTWLKWLGLQLFLSLLLSKYPKIITHCLSYRNQVNWFCMYLLSLHSDSTRLEPKNPSLTRWSPSPWCCRQILSVHATQNTVTFFRSDVLYTSDRVSGTRVTHVFVMWWFTWCDIVTFMWQS